MALTPAEKQKAYRDRKRGGPPVAKPPAPCGTVGGFRRHQRHGEPLCDECRVARNEYARIRRAKK